MAEAAGKPLDARRRKRRSELWIVAGVLAVLAAALAYAARDVLTGRVVEPATDVVAEPAATEQEKPASGLGQTADMTADLIDDDGETLWASPTHGPPLNLAYLPPGVEIILALRPAELLAQPEGAKVVAALGPWAESTLHALETTSGTSSRNFDRLLIGIQSLRNEDSSPKVLATKTPIKTTLETIQPDADDGCITLLGSGDYLMGWRQLKATSPPLPRDLERLIRYTDADRTVTLVTRPSSLFVDGGHLFHGELAPLRAELEDVFDSDIAAIIISVDWDTNFFIELVALPTLDSSPKELSEKLAAWIDQLPDKVEESVLMLNPSPYSRRVVARLPEMVRKFAAYTRHGFDRDAAVLRCYLPAAAGHNLIMGTELALAEGAGSGGATRAVVRPLVEASSPLSISERLRKKTSLRFGREELEAALNMLAQDIGVEIVIRGPDLQLEGITRNQLFGIDMADQRAAAILVEILRRANPDKLAAGPADPRQKLVYVVGPEAIFITTRTKAAERGETLPPAFRPAL